MIENAEMLVFRTPGQRPLEALPHGELSEHKNEPVTIIKRIQETELPKSVVLEHSDSQLEFQPTATYSRRIEGGSERQVTLNAPLILAQETALQLVDNWLRAAWIGRNSVQIKLPRRYQHLQVGDQVTFDVSSLPGKWLITRIEDADNLSIDLRSIETPVTSANTCQSRTHETSDVAQSGLPLVHLLDLPVLYGDDADNASRIAVSAKPWPGQYNVFSAPDQQSFAFRQSLNLRATIGQLKTNLSPGPQGRWDRANSVDVEIFEGSLSSQPSAQVLNGTNIAAIQTATGNWEIFQFASAELIDLGIWRLSGLLRSQAGTEFEMRQGAAIGAAFVQINSATPPIVYKSHEIGLDLSWKIAASGKSVSESTNPAQQFSPGLRGYLPLNPVHLKVRLKPADDLEISWIRRDRINADAWSDGDIPMSEESEAYSVTVISAGTVLRQWQVQTPKLIYLRSEQIADIGSFPAPLDIEVSQISATHGEGAKANLAFTAQ